MSDDRPKSAQAAHDAEAARAREDLARLQGEAGGVFSSALARAAGHMAAQDADPADGVEVWGRRIGRGLSLIGVLVLIYLIGGQRGWW